MNLARNKTVITLGILSLFFISLFIKLSIWQFERAKIKEQIIEKISHKNNIKDISSINNLSNLSNLEEYSIVKLEGLFDYTKTIFLANQYHNHQVGFHVLTPFILNNKLKSIILVNRGWIRSDQLLSDYNKSDIINITGILRNSNKNQYIIGENVSKFSSKNYNDVYQIQKIDLGDTKLRLLFQQHLGHQYLQLTEPKSFGYNTNWQLVNIPPEKHKAYAIQWLLLAISVVLLYSYLCYKTYRITS